MKKQTKPLWKGKNINTFWNENPNSAPVRLPDKSTTWFGLQIRELLSTPSFNIIMNCMKLNYVELFKFQIQTSETALADADACASIFTLLYYFINIKLKGLYDKN